VAVPDFKLRADVMIMASGKDQEYSMLVWENVFR